MGCDIHAHIEIKIKGKWQHWGNPTITRWYIVFEKICGVRGEEINAIAPPRGIPDDMSEVTKIAYEWEKVDSHSHTWLNQKELVELIKFIESMMKERWFEVQMQWGYICGNGFELSGPAEFEDVRLVCWFDN